MKRTFISTTTKPRFIALETLPNDDINIFRDRFFQPQLPVALRRNHFRYLPALNRWFSAPPANNHTQSLATLNYGYLKKHGDFLVPLEITLSSSHNVHSEENQSIHRDTFKRFRAPLSLFLDWTRSVQDGNSLCNDGRSAGNETSSFQQLQQPRFYLAQCQLLDLPVSLRGDFPTPRIISHAGKGDIYDATIWLGIAPTYTPLHRDPNPNLFVQLAGSKCVRLLAPHMGMAIFARVREKTGRVAGRQDAVFRGEEMMRGLEKQLLEQEVWRNPEMGVNDRAGMVEDEGGEKGAAYEAHLHTGDGIFIPKGWWHSIKGVGEGVTASVGHSFLGLAPRKF
jgi:hypothetical protein